ncbi:hypothetical protein [Streptomyces paludis]|uniref:Integral membrane protein n=1 Tax=Streptomyces paludis TaxID=2282738 RepID=A0A345I0C6_9ACTN|nr:hypothetical protein [Streptomyces paludis]AXG82400.1 hypothetical protein DVK44_06245 [Streptomyces paludis]
MDISGTRLRAARAALFTALVVTLSAGSHVLLSRVPLPLSVVAALSGVVFLAAYAAAGRERGFWRIASLVVPLELAADTVFTSGQRVCYGPAGGPVAGSLRAVGLDVLCGGALGGPAAGTPLPGVVPADSTAAALLNSPDPALPWLLLAVHVSIGLAAALWLRHGERALCRLVRAAGAAAFRPLLTAVAASATGAVRTVRRGPRPADRPRPAATRFLVHSVRRRGPPRPALGTV